MHIIARRRKLITLILAAAFCLDLALLVRVHAEEAGAAVAAKSVTTPDQAQQQPAGKFIQNLGDQAIKVIANKNLSQEQRAGQYHAILQTAFDVPTIGHFVLGRAWNSATPGQQQEYLKLFENTVVKIYGDRLSFYSGEKFVVTGVRPESDNDIIVNSEVQHADKSSPTTVAWRVRQKDGKFAIVDVIVEGVSQSVTQRQEYASILQRNNGDINALLSLMRQQLQNPSPGGQQNG